MQIKTALYNADHLEYGIVTIPFPIPKDQYDSTIKMLEAFDIGDPRERDCTVREVLGPVPSLKCLEGTQINVDELDYGDAFVQWCKQVIGLCLTAFLQSTILIAGLMVFRENALLGLGLMLSANEVPRIAGTFGLDTTTRANIMSAVYTAQAAVNTTRTIAQAVAK